MRNYPDWVLAFTDAELERRFGADTVARGQAYAQQSRVGRVQVTSGTHVLGAVQGSGRSSYETLLICQRGPASLVTSCTCPVRTNCKHAVALIVHMRDASRRAETPSWQRTLNPLMRRTPVGGGGARLALQFEGEGSHLSLRPLKRGNREVWVKSGATWDDLRFRGNALAGAHRDALLAIAASRRRSDFPYGYRADALPMSELRPDVWQLLRAARNAGVEFVDADRRADAPRLLGDPVVPGLDLDADEASPGEPGGVVLRPTLRLGEQELPVPAGALIGRPAHGLAYREAPDPALTGSLAYGVPRGRLVLAPLSRSLTEAEQPLFYADQRVRVPASDLGLFASGFLPQLRTHLDVVVAPEVVLPEASAPALLCRVEFGDKTASVHWGFRYRVGEQTHDLGLTPEASEPPLRNPPAEEALAESVPEGPWRMDAPGGGVELRPTFLTGLPLIEFVSRTLPDLRDRDDVEVVLNREPPDFREAEEAPTVNLSVTDSDAGDWFNLGVEVTIGGEKVPFGPLFTALSLGDDHLLLDSGTWFSLDHPELEQLRALIEEARVLVDRDGDGFRLRPEHAGLWDDLVRLGVVAEQSAAWQEAVGALLDLDELPNAAPPAGLRADLRLYQMVGYRWLSFLWRSRLGGILADEMGLGKTLQALALVAATRESGEASAPALVVAPTSVLGTWASEAARFTPGLRVATITETQKRRGVPLAEVAEGADLVLTSYTLLRLEAEDYQAQEWSVVLLDEAQFVKNYASKAYHAVRRLRSRLKIALTGTPLENNLMDLWSLLSIAAPGLFPDPKAFTEVYRKPIEAGESEVLGRLHTRIRPLILRRTKAAVASELPPKQEQVVPVELTPAHRRIYDRQLARERQKVLGLVGELGRNRITILRSLTLLRQLSLAPVLVDPEHPAHAAKLDVLVELMRGLIDEGHRALVFSQFTGFLALVKKRLDAEHIGYEYLDGRTRDRAARIDAFKHGDAPAFLISLKAGGFGLTLTEADYVFILDPWWNPAAETQAIDRTHRIGQDKPVNVYRLVSTDTIEEKVVALQQRKRDLFDQVVGAASDVAAPLSAEDIRGLLS